MTTAENYRPKNMSPVTPHLICRNACDAIDFYVRAFGATEENRFNGPDGKIMNAMITLEGGSIMLVDENVDYGMRGPQSVGGTPSSIHVYVPDVDAFAAKAEAEGATITMLVADQFWGDRFCMMVDPFGHAWSFATHKQDLSPEEMEAAVKKAFTAVAEAGCGPEAMKEAVQ